MQSIRGGLSSLLGKLPKPDPSLLAGFGSLATRFLKSQRALKIESIPPVSRKDANRIKITYGPYKRKSSKVWHIDLLSGSIHCC
jgi:hypothetical protein